MQIEFENLRCLHQAIVFISGGNQAPGSQGVLGRPQGEGGQLQGIPDRFGGIEKASVSREVNDLNRRFQFLVKSLLGRFRSEKCGPWLTAFGEDTRHLINLLTGAGQGWQNPVLRGIAELSFEAAREEHRISEKKR